MKEGFTWVCCLCGKPSSGFGNNPFPLCDENDTESRCCDICNMTKVTPARIKMIRERKDQDG